MYILTGRSTSFKEYRLGKGEEKKLEVTDDDVTMNEIPTDHYSHKVQCYIYFESLK